MTTRVLPPVNGAQQTIGFNGRTYTAAPGQVLDVLEADALVLQANGWLLVSQSGPTSGRPANTAPQSGSAFMLAPGARYFDTTLNKLIIYDGATWRDPASGNSV